MDADGTNVQQLTTHPASDALPLWSPDGTQIHFVTQRNGEGDLAVVASDGGPVRMLTETPTINEVRGWWTPDGAMIVYVAGDRSNQIVSVNLAPLLSGGGQ
jgi:Tol biopolymer transport system component